MKIGFEFAIITFVGMFFVALSISLLTIMMQFNQAKIYAEGIADTIEHYNSYQQQTINAIDKLPSCNKCIYKVFEESNDKYAIEVRYPISIGFITFSRQGIVYATTKIIEH